MRNSANFYKKKLQFAAVRVSVFTSKVFKFKDLPKVRKLSIVNLTRQGNYVEIYI